MLYQILQSLCVIHLLILSWIPILFLLFLLFREWLRDLTWIPTDVIRCLDIHILLGVRVILVLVLVITTTLFILPLIIHILDCPIKQVFHPIHLIILQDHNAIFLLASVLMITTLILKRWNEVRISELHWWFVTFLMGKPVTFRFHYRYTRDAFVKIINTKCKNLYDFLYLPMDQNTHCNMGYGYVNMINVDAVIRIYENVFIYHWLSISSTIADGLTQRVWRSVQYVMDVCKVVMYR